MSSLTPGAKPTDLDAQLAQGTSAVRLAQTLGANYLLQVSIAGADSAKNNVDAYGVKQTNDVRTVRVTYKILDGNNGASLAADTVRVVHQRTYEVTRVIKEFVPGTTWTLTIEIGDRSYSASIGAR